MDVSTRFQRWNKFYLLSILAFLLLVLVRNEERTVLFDDAMALFLRSIRLKEFSGETQRAYERDLKLFNTFLSAEYNAAVYIDEITVHDIEQYLHYLAVDKALKARSRNRYVSTVSSMFNYALKKEWIEKNPAMFIDKARVTDQKKCL